MKPSVKSLAARKGTTLIENSIAIMIVAIIIVALINSFSMITRHIRIAHHRVVAINQAQSKLEKLENQGYYGITWSLYSGAGQAQNVIIDSYSLDTAADDLLGVMQTRAINLLSGGNIIGRKMIITVNWTSGSSNLSETLEKLIYQPD